MNWALIGYGGMGAWHADKLLTLPEVRVCGIYDIDPERGELAQERGLPVYPSLEALLSDKKVEFVTIATPNDVHRDIAVAAMKAGKHVICEKPVTLSSDDLQAMIDDPGVKAVVSYQGGYGSVRLLPLLDLTSNVSLTRFAARGCDFRTLDLANCSAWMESADVRGCRQLETLYLAGRQQGNFYYDGITEVVRR